MLADVQSPSSFADRVYCLLERVQYRRMETEADLDAVLRLRYEAYLKERAIPVSQSERLEDAFDEVDNVYNIGVFVDGELASALRLHRLSNTHQKSPALETFGDFLVQELRAGKLILDPNRFVANYRLARLYPALPYATARLGVMACVHFGIDLMTMTVRAEHQAFYKRTLFAYQTCPPRPYPLLSKPISLLFTDFVRDADRILRQRPYWVSSESERQALFGKGPTSFRSWSGAAAPTFVAQAASRLARVGLTHKPTIASPPIAAAR